MPASTTGKQTTRVGQRAFMQWICKIRAKSPDIIGDSPGDQSLDQ